MGTIRVGLEQKKSISVTSQKEGGNDVSVRRKDTGN